jgi:hypothetical protein
MEGTDLVTQQPYSSKTGLASILHPGKNKTGFDQFQGLQTGGVEVKKS